MNSINDKSVRRTKRWFIGYLLLSIVFFAGLFYLDGNEEHKMKEQLESVEENVKQLNKTIETYRAIISTTVHSDLSQLNQLNDEIDQLRNRLELDTLQTEYLDNYVWFLQSIRDSIQGIRHHENNRAENRINLQQRNQILVRKQDSLKKNWHKKKLKMQNRLRNLQHKLDHKKEQLSQQEHIKVITFESSKGKKVHYLGETDNGKAYGGGIGIWSTGGMYQGDWKSNQRHGEGRYEWSNNHIYEGEFKNDVREGEGIYYWPSGERYEGEWKNDRRNGKGTLYDKDGNIQYQGQWKKDEIMK